MTGMGFPPAGQMPRGMPHGRNLLPQINPIVNHCKFVVKYVTIVLHFKNNLAHKTGECQNT